MTDKDSNFLGPKISLLFRLSAIDVGYFEKYSYIQHLEVTDAVSGGCLDVYICDGKPLMMSIEPWKFQIVFAQVLLIWKSTVCW